LKQPPNSAESDSDESGGEGSAPNSSSATGATPMLGSHRSKKGKRIESDEEDDIVGPLEDSGFQSLSSSTVPNSNNLAVPASSTSGSSSASKKSTKDKTKRKRKRRSHSTTGTNLPPMQK